MRASECGSTFSLSQATSYGHFFEHFPISHPSLHASVVTKNCLNANSRFGNLKECFFQYAILHSAGR